MVRKYFAFLIIILLIPSLSLAATFEATVDRNNAAIGESFSLKLELTDTSAKGKPDTSVLQQNFTIVGQSQSSRTSIINGSYSSSKSWNYTLIPKKSGNITIPAISINTSDGTLNSRSISMNIGKASSLPSSDNKNGINMSASVSKKNPYKDEPIIYTVRFSTDKDIGNVEMGELSVENAIVEQFSKPQISDRVINGKLEKVIDSKYIITPVKSGRITIPSIIIKGDVPVRKNINRHDPFGAFDSFGMFSMHSLEPFAVASKEITIDVKPVASSIQPWLPATSVKISESLDNSTKFKAGEPFSRTITIVAEGIASSQLKSVIPASISNDDFKSYSDNPTIDDDIKNNKIVSWSSQSYTLIPQKSGQLTLPEISIPWWNVEKNELEYAQLNARTIDVQPSSQSAVNQPAKTSNDKPQTQASNTITKPTQTTPSPTTANVQQNSIFYMIIGVLVVVLVFVLLWVLSLKRKITGLSDNGQPEVVKEKSEKKQSQAPSCNNTDIDSINTAEKLKEFLQNYAHTKWNASPNASLEKIFSLALEHNPDVQKEDVKQVVKSIEDALYADKKIDISLIKEQCSLILKSNNKKEKKEKREALPELNPS